jgi:hypothetical protein
MKRLEKKALSDLDIHHFVPNAKIIRYSELGKYNSIDELLPNNPDFCFLLYEWRPNAGHWICLLKSGRTIEVFDSYGVGIDKELRWVPRSMRQVLNEGTPVLRDLLARSSYHIVWNKKPFQSSSEGVNTCGRHCVARVLAFINQHQDLPEYQKMMKDMRNRTGLSYDEIVSKETE